MLVLGPVQVVSADDCMRGERQRKRIIELLLRADASPATYRGCEQFLTAVCELAADYHAFDELRRLRKTTTIAANCCGWVATCTGN